MQTTFIHLLKHHAQQRPTASAMREKEYGIWQTMTWRELLDLVEKLAIGLQCRGFKRGEHLAIIGNNRVRLYTMMLAAQTLGGIVVPLYQDAVAAEFVFPINNAEIRFCAVEDQEQVDKLLEIHQQCPCLMNIYYDDPRGLRNYNQEGLFSIDDLITQGTIALEKQKDFFENQLQQLNTNDVAAMFFTSGTTGNPKGVVHTYRSLLDRAKAGADFDALTNQEEVLAYLPPAWIGQNIFSYAQWLYCGYVVNCPESASTINIDLKEIGPTYYFAPPRIFEGLLTGVTIRMEDASRIKRWMYYKCMQWAKRIGPLLMDGHSVSALDRLRYGVGNLLVYGPLRNNLGFSRVRVGYTAGEAIGPDLFTFYRSIGINLKQLYGSTETAVFVCIQPNGQVKSDTVGIPIDGVEVKISDESEVLVRSAGLLKEYYKNEKATQEVLDKDGWYHTSDAGFIDAGGHLKIIDRIKDVGRIKGGSFDGAMFAPKYVENKLKFSPYIKEAVTFGDGKSSVCAMINIDFDAMGNWAERRNLPYAGYSDLAQKEAVIALVAQCVDDVNKSLSQDKMLAGSQISRFLILHKELDADDGELTRTNKVRRGFIAEKYAILVQALYGGKAEQFIQTQVKFEDGREGSVSATLKLLDAKVYNALQIDQMRAA